MRALLPTGTCTCISNTVDVLPELACRFQLDLTTPRIVVMEVLTADGPSMFMFMFMFMTPSQLRVQLSAHVQQ